ncbi:MAG: hypothetical protein OET55_05220 [Desulfuromonadales bacterium]|jgi:hypothetical protein|nr:hypothetical protein [Desulfuromonadales bacterium]MDH3807621.1 hypothetical protein [Desulfuromonadales bacterium]MDH3960657.1 hypothetical protein [Desulfuromonadales bacterium]MDH4024850.1 hypothetical protein [Desulfuromonadales bacterium]
MPLSDMPMRLLVILFLAVFVLIGINPAIQKAAVSLRKLLRSAAQRKELIGTRLDDLHAEVFAESRSSRQLNDFEIIVIRRLAQAGGKALSRKQLNAPLLLGTAVLQKTLKSLHRRELIHVRISTLLGPKFTLSETGRRYAIEQGYIIHIREPKEGMG